MGSVPPSHRPQPLLIVSRIPPASRDSVFPALSQLCLSCRLKPGSLFHPLVSLHQRWGPCSFRFALDSSSCAFFPFETGPSLPVHPPRACVLDPVQRRPFSRLPLF